MSSLGLERCHGADGYALPYPYDGQSFYDLVGVVPEADRQARPIPLGAHYESVIDALCTDDNMARSLGIGECERRNHFVTFLGTQAM